ncbi:NAD(P)H-binding protein [Actinomadura sp. WMMB 499]|uniref:NmrA family NAD(P)-binding protein n=1 Tax=Actinomadura sp. WMMB 499 TaxID=1219491 RepID=UPI001243AA5C|nr:NAD(P)H-binding protein [Actinomadura sp. WMMB 499]QFG21320.1 NAD(P)H-binding protein [Actinomadura sp. WMMB 499]
MIVVTGATGVVGRPLVEFLDEAGADVRAVTRDAGAAKLSAGVEVVEGDPRRPATLAAALEGATSLFLHPRAAGDACAELVALAKERGIERVVALAAMNVDDDLAQQPSRYRGDRNKEAEDAAVGSGLEWTSLRAGFFALNTLTMWDGQIGKGDVVHGPYAEATEAPVHERDLAAVAAHALLTDDLVGRKPVLTGPQSLTYAEMLAAIGKAIDRPLSFQEIPPDAFKAHMMGFGFPEAFVDTYLAVIVKSVGRPALVTGEVEKILDRPALTFAEWAADHAADPPPSDS